MAFHFRSYSILPPFLKHDNIESFFSDQIVSFSVWSTWIDSGWQKSLASTCSSNMAAAFPYSHVACPCTSLTTGAAPTPAQKRRSSYQPPLDASAGDIPDTFNPHDPRANYSLYPYDHLLYCDECHQIRCPRCWTEEILNWYCPSCLFEVPSSVVKSDGNR